MKRQLAAIGEQQMSIRDITWIDSERRVNINDTRVTSWLTAAMRLNWRDWERRRRCCVFDGDKCWTEFYGSFIHIIYMYSPSSLTLTFFPDNILLLDRHQRKTTMVGSTFCGGLFAGWRTNQQPETQTPPSPPMRLWLHALPTTSSLFTGRIEGQRCWAGVWLWEPPFDRRGPYSCSDRVLPFFLVAATNLRSPFFSRPPDDA